MLRLFPIPTHWFPILRLFPFKRHGFPILRMSPLPCNTLISHHVIVSFTSTLRDFPFHNYFHFTNAWMIVPNTNMGLFPLTCNTLRDFPSSDCFHYQHIAWFPIMWLFPLPTHWFPIMCLFPIPTHWLPIVWLFLLPTHCMSSHQVSVSITNTMREFSSCDCFHYQHTAWFPIKWLFPLPTHCVISHQVIVSITNTVIPHPTILSSLPTPGWLFLLPTYWFPIMWLFSLPTDGVISHHVIVFITNRRCDFPSHDSFQFSNAWMIVSNGVMGWLNG